jgi:hypothetical protein
MAASTPPAPAGTELVPGRKPPAALALGIAALVTGFAVVTLLAAVVAIVLASLTFQEISEGRVDPGRRGLAVAGMVCAIVAFAIWIPVIVAVAVSES